VLRSLYAASREKIAHAPESLIDMPNLHFERENDILSALDLYRAGCDFADALQHAGEPPAAMHSQHSIAIWSSERSVALLCRHRTGVKLTIG
jgi:predicted nucleic-acid-binding protein